MQSKPENMKICLAASAGGHLSQLLKLAPAWDGREIFFVTTTEVVRDKLKKHGTVYIVGECNHQNPLRVLKVLAKCVKVIWHQRPDVVISTSAATECLMCFLGKLTGAKIIWLDSITNVERLSLSGRLIRPVSDLILTQWQNLEDKYKKVEYAGSVI